MRGADLRRVYAWLAAAVAALVLFEMALFRSGAAAAIHAALTGVPWLLVLGAWMVLAWLASRAAWRVRSPTLQVAALAAYVVGKGLILVPLLVRAERAAPGAIASAAELTALGFAGLTLVVWMTGADFSYLRALLYWGGCVALLAIVAALSFGFRLGPWFSVAMVALAGAGILHDTSRLARRRVGGRHAAAALGLFASVALMFWYLLRLVGRTHRG